MQEIAELQVNAERLSAIQGVLAHPGWALIKSHFDNVIVAVQSQLAVEENYQKIRRLQERLRAFSSMLETVAVLSQQHAESVDLLDSVVNENKERDQYGL